MSIDLAKLVVTLEAESARYQSELKKAQTQLQKFRNDSKSLLSHIVVDFADLARGAGRALYELGKAQIDVADDMSKMSQAAGVSVEWFSKTSYAADLAGVNLETFAKSMSTLTKNAGEAASGTKAQAEAFAMLGVSVTDSNGRMKPTEQLFAEVVDGLSSMDNGAKKNIISQGLFSKTFRDMMPLLNAGTGEIKRLTDEAASFGYEVTAKSGKAAEDFNDTLDTLGYVAKGAAMQMQEKLLPTLQAVADEFVRGAKEGGGFSAMGDVLTVTLQAVVLLASDVAFAFKMVGKEVGVIAAQVGRLAKGDFAGSKAMREAWVKEVKVATEELELFQAKVLGTVPEVVQPAARRKPRGKDSDLITNTTNTKAHKDAVGDLIKALEREAATFGMSADAARVHQIALAGGTPQQIAYADAISRTLDMRAKEKAAFEEGKALTLSMRAPIEVLIDQENRLGLLLSQNAISQTAYTAAMKKARDEFAATDPVLQQVLKDWEAVNQVIAQTPTGQAEEIARMRGVLQDAYKAGQFGAEGSADAMKKYAEAVNVVVEGTASKTKESGDLMSEYAKSAAQNMQSSLADFLFDPAKDGFKGMADGFAQTLKRMVADAAAAKIMEGLSGMASSGMTAAKGASASGGGWGAIAGAFVSAIFSGSSSGSAGSTGSGTPAPVEYRAPTAAPKARGGVGHAGQTFWVGEEGPELRTAGSTERITSNAESMAAMRGSGGRGIIQNFNISTPDANSFRASERQTMQRARRGLSGG